MQQNWTNVCQNIDYIKGNPSSPSNFVIYACNSDLKENMFLPDPSRVITRFLYNSDERGKNIIRQVLAMADDEVQTILNMELLLKCVHDQIQQISG